MKSRVIAVVGALTVIALGIATSEAQVPGPLNDLGALSQGAGQTPAKAAIQRNSEPKLLPTPVVKCLPGSRPEPGVDGRVPAGSADNGLWCNVRQISHQGDSGGFKVYRYVDASGHECAYYDTALLFPLNAFNPAGPSLGVVVLDMTDHKHPVQTATLTDQTMVTPHESLNVNTARGLLAADNGNPATEPGLVSVYDIHNDCRHPVFQASGLFARFGHESGFSQDGRTFYATGTAEQSITAIDVTDPQNPHAVWQGNVLSHGMSLSDDGNRAYVADPTGGNMAILDTSEVQARKPNPQVREVSRLTWDKASIPQNAIPFTKNGKPYVLEFDEYTAGTLKPGGSTDDIGAGHIVDISNEKKPRVVSLLRLAINQPKEHHDATAAGDPGTGNAAQGYAAHYCNIPTRVNPRVVACSFIASGLRVFDISDIAHPKEIAYFVPPPKPRAENGGTDSDFAMSMPAFDAVHREVWYTDGETGFYDVQLARKVWPGASPSGGTTGGGGRCVPAPHRVTVHRDRRTVVRVTLTQRGKRIAGRTISLKGPGFNRRMKTDSHGRASFTVRPSRNGQASVSSAFCGDKLSIKVTTAHQDV
jgi:hypothetical protein